MAMIVNKMFRVIPKKQKIENIDCHSICTNLAETGGELWEKVIYYVNEEENCLDIKYKSRKGRGELGIEDQLEVFDIWNIINYEGGPDYIYCLNSKEYDLDMSNDTMNLYSFDEVRLKANHEKLMQDFYPHFFHFKDDKPPFYLEKVLRKKENNFVSFKLEGIYNAGTMYNVGAAYSKIPEKVTKEVFFRPRNTSYWEAEFLFLNNIENYAIKKLLQSCLKDKLTSFEWDRANLVEIQFCYKNRLVKKIETAEHWRYYNAEFFDNTIEKHWIDYMALRKRGLV